MKDQCDSITPVALVSSICFSSHIPLCLTVHPPALFSQYSSTEPSVWGHLFKAFSSPRILDAVTDMHTKNMSTKNPAYTQPLLAKDSLTRQPAVPPCLPLPHLPSSFSVSSLYVHNGLHTHPHSKGNDWLDSLATIAVAFWQAALASWACRWAM